VAEATIPNWQEQTVGMDSYRQIGAIVEKNLDLGLPLCAA